MIGGVASGMADYLDADVALIRIAWVALTLLSGGAVALAYLAAWVLVPEEGAVAGHDAATSTWHRRRHSSRWGGVVWGVILIAVGVIVLLSQLDIPMPPWRGLLAGALILVGLGIAVGARRGLNGGLLVLAIILTALLVSGSQIPLTSVNSGFGDRRVTITAPGQLDDHYGHAFGAMRIEIAANGLAPGTTSLDTSIAFGDLRITVPENVGVRVTASNAFSSVRVFEEEFSAFGDHRVIASPGYDQAERRLDVTVNTAFGATRISRGQP